MHRAHGRGQRPRHRRRRVRGVCGGREGELPGLAGARRRPGDHAGGPANVVGGMAATLDSLIDELERSYRETQERLSDPSVYNDHREAAEVGRRLKELEGPYKLAQEWRSARDDLAAARDDADLRELVPELEERTARLEGELRLAMVPNDPADSKDVIVEVRQGVGGDEAALWAGDVYRMLARYAERRGFKVEELDGEPIGQRRLQGGHVRGQGRRRIFRLQVGGRHASRPARARDRERRPHPHLDRHGRRDARSRRGRGRDRTERPQDRRLPLDRARRPVRQHDRLGRPHHARPDRRRRLDAGREVAAAEPREGDARPARTALRARSSNVGGPSSMRTGAPRSARATARRRSAPTTFPRAGSPTIGSS